jgi:hypothetical protein
MTPSLPKGRGALSFCERWASIPDTAGRFEVSDHGRVRRACHTGRGGKVAGTPVRLGQRREGYLRLNTTLDGRRYSRALHQLVIEAFVGPVPAGQQVAHLNGDPSDNRLVNLKVCTPSENASHKYGHGTMPLGERVHSARLKASDVAAIRASAERNATLGERYKVSPKTIWKIRRGLVWRHLEGAPQ